MYRVGQVLFVILNKRQQVIPVQVNEQVVRRSLSGEDVSYTVLIPAKENDKLYNLDEVDGDVYESIEEVRQVMHEHASSIINSITDKAIKIASSRFEFSPNPLDDIMSEVNDLEPKQESEVGSNKEEVHQVTLEDGTVANVRLPEGM